MQSWNSEIIEADFVEAALDPSLWLKALERVTSLTGSEGALLLPVNGGVLKTVPYTESIAGSAEDYVKNGWHLHDERHRGVLIMKRRGVVCDLDIVDSDMIAKHPYYQEFLAPHKLRWFAGVGIMSGDDMWCLSIQRRSDQDPFSEAELRQLGDLSSRLSGTAAVARALGDSAAKGALDAFQISGTAVALINRYGKIFEINDAARQLFVGELKVTNGRLVAGTSQATAAFERAVHELLNRHDGGLSPPIAFPRKGRRALLAYPTKLSRARGNALADCQAMAIFIDPETGHRPAEASLRLLFKLTEAEARLAVQLASGDALENVADRLGIAKETSRSQLKNVFAKTGVRRQAELVALLGGVI